MFWATVKDDYSDDSFQEGTLKIPKFQTHDKSQSVSGHHLSMFLLFR